MFLWKKAFYLLYSKIHVISSMKSVARHARKPLLMDSEFQKIFIQSLPTLYSSAAVYVCVWVCLYSHYVGSDFRFFFLLHTATRHTGSIKKCRCPSVSSSVLAQTTSLPSQSLTQNGFRYAWEVVATYLSPDVQNVIGQQPLKLLLLTTVEQQLTFQSLQMSAARGLQKSSCPCASDCCLRLANKLQQLAINPIIIIVSIYNHFQRHMYWYFVFVQ